VLSYVTIRTFAILTTSANGAVRQLHEPPSDAPAGKNPACGKAMPGTSSPCLWIIRSIGSGP
jgi:hypothetical protein